MAFTGWPVEAIEFFEQLEDDNTKAFWTDNLQIYEESVRAPMTELLTELEKQFGEGKIFRPYRDVRFSKNKAPYKTNIAARMEKGGYVSLSADGFSTGTGYYMMAKDQLARFRSAVDDNTKGRQLERAVAKIRAAEIEVTSHDSLKTAPRGYDTDHPRIELLRMKGCVAWRQWDVGAWLDTDEAKERVIAVMNAAKPLVKWLDTNVGPSELPNNRWG